MCGVFCGESFERLITVTQLFVCCFLGVPYVSVLFFCGSPSDVLWGFDWAEWDV